MIAQVQENWKNRLRNTWSGSSLEAYCNQVETCTEIALNCLEEDSQKRLDILSIIDKLNRTETDIDKVIRNLESLFSLSEKFLLLVHWNVRPVHLQSHHPFDS